MIKDIMAHFEDMDVNFAIPSQGILKAPKDDRHIRYLATADKVPYEVVDYDVFLQEPQAKLIIICDESYMAQVVARSQTFHNEQFKCASLKTASILFEYMDPRVSKTYGLTQVMAMQIMTTT